MEEIRAASYRGVPFVVTASSGSFGRRVVMHEFPLNDEGAAEDMGRGLREFRLTGFVIGDDWKTQIQRLIVAVETSGDARLVHPLHGDMLVRPAGKKALETTWTSEELRMVAFRLAVVEAGTFKFPTHAPASIGRSNSASLGMNDSVLAGFLDAFDVILGGFVLAGAIADIAEGFDDVIDAVGAPLAVIETASDLVDDATTLRDTAADLVDDPLGLVVAVQGLFDKVENLAALDAFTAGIDDGGASTDPTAGDTPHEVAENKNARATEDMFTHLALSSLTLQVADTEYSSHDAASAARDKYAARLTLAAAQPFLSGDAFDALIQLRTALVINVTAKAVDLPRLQTFTPPGIETTLTLAHELYGDASRAREIEDRNDMHAVFADPVLVLNE